MHLSTQTSLAISIGTARNSVFIYRGLEARTDKCSVSEVVNVVPGRSNSDKYGLDQNAVLPYEHCALLFSSNGTFSGDW